MEPLPPNDSLWKLLGKARQIEPRSDFVRNVVREARQTPQTQGWLAALKEWLGAASSPILPRLAWAAALVAVAALVVQGLKTPSSEPALAEVKTEPPVAVAIAPEALPLTDVETQLENIEQVNALLALEDTSTLTDTEISFLLY